MAGKLLHGALVQFSKAFLIPVPNVITFQYNPETITHSWKPSRSGSSGNPLAVSGEPGESFSFTMAMDANDTIADGSGLTGGLAKASGIYPRLAALEMLLYPEPDSGGASLVGSVSVSIGPGGISASASLGGKKHNVPAHQVPTTLFIWGPGRIVPVAVTDLTITEKLYHPTLLHPVYAEAQVALEVLTPDDMKSLKSIPADISKVAYSYSLGLRKALAVANLANSGEAIIGMLPV